MQSDINLMQSEEKKTDYIAIQGQCRIEIINPG